jgi:O-methyltransferase
MAVSSNDTDVKNTQGIINTARYGIERWGFLGTVARFLLLKSETRRFLTEKTGAVDRNQKADLLKAFGRIQSHVHCAHSPYQFVLIAQYLLEVDVPGPIVECGCFKGGSTAKLSLLAKMTNRKLFVCDSFEGLPRPKGDNESHLAGHGTHPDVIWSEGEYCGTLDEVRRNVNDYGCLDVCTFVPGFYENSLKDLDVHPASVVMDVDLFSSARDCLQYLWPRTADNGLWFTHEASFPEYINGIMDADWWLETLHEPPPIIFGAGNGLSECASALAYFRKTRAKQNAHGHSA